MLKVFNKHKTGMCCFMTSSGKKHSYQYSTLLRSTGALRHSPNKSSTTFLKDILTSCSVRLLPSAYFQRLQTLSQMLPQSTHPSLSQRCSSPSQWRLNMNTYMNIWITEQVVIVIHLHVLCRGCKVFCWEPVVLLSMGFLTERLKWGRGE